MSDDPQPRRVDLGKSEHDDPPFDPYRFGKPEHPVPPEYAPPGYVPDPPQADTTRSPFGGSPYGQSGPYPSPGQPGAPYGQQGQYGPGQYGPGQYGQGQYGQGEYGQSPYGPPPYASTGYAPQGGNGKAVAGMVLGIVSLVLFWTSFFDIIFIVLALIFGLLGLSASKSRNGKGRGMAVAGLICMGIGVVATVLYTVFLLNVADKCGGIGNGDDPGFSQCIQDHF